MFFPYKKVLARGRASCRLVDRPFRPDTGNDDEDFDYPHYYERCLRFARKYPSPDHVPCDSQEYWDHIDDLADSEVSEPSKASSILEISMDALIHDKAF